MKSRFRFIFLLVLLFSCKSHDARNYPYVEINKISIFTYSHKNQNNDDTLILVNNFLKKDSITIGLFFDLLFVDSMRTISTNQWYPNYGYHGIRSKLLSFQISYTSPPFFKSLKTDISKLNITDTNFFYLINKNTNNWSTYHFNCFRSIDSFISSVNTNSKNVNMDNLKYLPIFLRISSSDFNIGKSTITIEIQFSDYSIKNSHSITIN